MTSYLNLAKSFILCQRGNEMWQTPTYGSIMDKTKVNLRYSNLLSTLTLKFCVFFPKFANLIICQQKRNLFTVLWSFHKHHFQNEFFGHQDKLKMKSLVRKMGEHFVYQLTIYHSIDSSTDSVFCFKSDSILAGLIWRNNS